MRILFVHERFGTLGGAEANALVTADELQAKGWKVGLLHGPGTGRGEQKWEEVFQWRRSLGKDDGESKRIVFGALKEFQPDAIYVHKMGDLRVI